MTLPLQLVDQFLLQYNMGQVLALVFVLVMVASLPLRSRRVLAINTILFGVIFLLTPVSMAPVQYKLFGLALIVVGPLLYATASR